MTDSGEQLRLFLKAFAGDGREPLVTELRALNCPQQWGEPKTEFGFFDLASEEGQKAFGGALKSILTRPADKQPEGVYVTLNPVSPDLLARANNRLKVAKDKGKNAKDENVTARRWVLIDVDPERIAGVSATDDEKAAAKLVVDGVRQDLEERKWSPPVVIDSGNGYHLWYPIDLPRDDGGLVEKVVKGLALLHDSDCAKLDTSVFNPSRITKLPGTWARKGDSTKERPHRLARILEVPRE